MAPTMRYKGFIEVQLWGQVVGVASWSEAAGHATFEYEAAFARKGLPIAPITMPTAQAAYSFPHLSRSGDFQGLPGLLADALPDRWGNALIERWLSGQGRDIRQVSPLERLCFVGDRAMGALEFKPKAARGDKVALVQVDELVRLAQQVLSAKAAKRGRFDSADEHALAKIIRVGSSVGGNRAKALIAWDPKTDEVRAGDTAQPARFQPWLLKFDGTGTGETAQPQGYGRIEYAYSLMAKAAGLSMAECRLWQEHGRAHFMTRRFDRLAGGKKAHYQSFGALAHLDKDAPPHGWEDAFRVARELGLSHPDLEEMLRRLVFNVAARNQDDHVKNLGFIMGQEGDWGLAPAFDVTYAFNPRGPWTQQHQMSVGGKTKGISHADLLAFAKREGIKAAPAIIAKVSAAVGQWPSFAREAGLAKAKAIKLGECLLPEFE